MTQTTETDKETSNPSPQPAKTQPDEWETIRLIKEIVNKDSLLSNIALLPIGDDCACLQPRPPGRILSCSADSFYEGTHFPAGADPFLVGYRTLNAAASDLAAMGSSPLGFLLAAGLPTHMRQRQNIVHLAAGFRLAALRTRLLLLGGNLSASERTNLTITVIGENPNKQSVLRRGTASVGDSLFVSGCLGGSAAGLQYAKFSAQELDTRSASLRASYFCPQARLRLGASLRGIASSCIDISDGIASDLPHLLTPAGSMSVLPHKTSGKSGEIEKDRKIGARLFLSKLPLSPELTPTRENRILALTGDDYELLFTVPAAQEKITSQLGEKLGVAVKKIGEITAEPAMVCTEADGKEYPLPAGGYKHF